jgi:hypothetical protein
MERRQIFLMQKVSFFLKNQFSVKKELHLSAIYEKKSYKYLFFHIKQ